MVGQRLLVLVGGGAMQIKAMLPHLVRGQILNYLPSSFSPVEGTLGCALEGAMGWPDAPAARLFVFELLGAIDRRDATAEEDGVGLAVGKFLEDHHLVLVAGACLVLSLLDGLLALLALLALLVQLALLTLLALFALLSLLAMLALPCPVVHVGLLGQRVGDDSALGVFLVQLLGQLGCVHLGRVTDSGMRSFMRLGKLMWVCAFLMGLTVAFFADSHFLCSARAPLAKLIPCLRFNSFAR